MLPFHLNPDHMGILDFLNYKPITYSLNAKVLTKRERKRRKKRRHTAKASRQRNRR